jgi:hypothetical protein
MEDTESGTVYYTNKHTGESQWEKPAGFDGQWLFEEDTSGLVARGKVRKNAGMWQEYWDEEAKCAYYYNTDTAAAQYDAPPDFLLDWVEIKAQEGRLEAESIPTRKGGPWEEFTLLRPRHAFTDDVRKQRSEAKESAASDGDPWPESAAEGPPDGESEDPLTYFRHFDTGELCVQTPSDFAEQHRMGSLRASGRVLPRRQVQGRIELMDSRTGNIFYFDRQARLYSWDKPIGFDDLWLESEMDTDGGRSLVERSKKKKVISSEPGAEGAASGERGGEGENSGEGWAMYVDPDTETMFYYHSGFKTLQASLPPADAHGMPLPPSAIGQVGTAMSEGAVRGKVVEKAPPPELEEVIASKEVPAQLMAKLGRVQRERVPYEERRTHLRWIEEFIEAEEYITADSVADQILQMQNEARGHAAVLGQN